MLCRLFSHNFLLLFLLFNLAGCGKELGCAIYGDDVSGHVNFGDYKPIEKGTRLWIQYSIDNFNSVAGSNSVVNTQGLVTVPYSLCAPKDTTFVVRAFQDTNKNDALDAGELYGLDDQTSTGDATYISEKIDTVKSQTIIKNLNITLDSP